MAKRAYRADVNSHRGLPEWLLLHQAYSATFKALELHLLSHGFTMPRLYLMGVLASAEGPRTLSELAESMVREPHTLVRIVDELERRGWVKRSRDHEDRRRKPIEITKKGLVAFRKAFAVSVAAGREMISVLSDRELSELGRHLGLLRDGALVEIERLTSRSRKAA
jgi:MarR family transcriptional regulator for hemolysin